MNSNIVINEKADLVEKVSVLEEDQKREGAVKTGEMGIFLISFTTSIENNRSKRPIFQ